MPESHVEVYLHLVWATWDRLPLLQNEVETVVYSHIQAECKRRGVELLAICGTNDHIHILVRLRPTISISDLVKHIKGASSHIVNERRLSSDEFKWQGGYAALSVSPVHIPRIRSYVLKQKEHHQERKLSRVLELSPTRATDRKVAESAKAD